MTDSPADIADPTDPDPRLRGWRERLASRADEAVEALAAVPGVTGVVLGGSVGRGEHWPLSDIDVIVVSSGRPVAETAADVDRQAYQLSEMWGSSGIYTAVDAGRLTFDEADVRHIAALRPSGVGDHLTADERWLHGIDKTYGGVVRHDRDGAARALLDWSARLRFDPTVVATRIETWLARAESAVSRARRRLESADPVGTWVSIRRAGTALAEVATERWGQGAGSLGRYWTRFEERARHEDPALGAAVVRASHAAPELVAPRAAQAPEWLRHRIALSFAARRLVKEELSPEQNARDNVLAYAVLYRDRFPGAAAAWMRPDDHADPHASLTELTALTHDLRPGDP